MATIMVVDDVALERNHVSDILRRGGHTVVEAENGAAALALLKTAKVDAVIMDIVMPELDGFAATKRIKLDPATKAVPVIIVSSKAQESDKFRGKALGANGYLVKPVQANDLQEELKKVRIG